jgi:hypothetical protein
VSHDKLLGNVLTQFENGCQLDLRAKLAVEFMKTAGFINGVLDTVEPSDTPAPRVVVEFAFDMAECFVEEGRKRELIHSLPEGGLSGPFKDHIERSVLANLYQSEVMEKEQRRRTPQLMQPPPGLVLPNGAANEQ